MTKMLGKENEKKNEIALEMMHYSIKLVKCIANIINVNRSTSNLMDEGACNSDTMGTWHPVIVCISLITSSLCKNRDVQMGQPPA